MLDLECGSVMRVGLRLHQPRQHEWLQGCSQCTLLWEGRALRVSVERIEGIVERGVL